MREKLTLGWRCQPDKKIIGGSETILPLVGNGGVQWCRSVQQEMSGYNVNGCKELYLSINIDKFINIYYIAVSIYSVQQEMSGNNV